MVVAPVWTFVARMQDADLHLVWLMLFAAEHGATIGGVPGAALLVVAVATVGQLLGVLGAVPVAAGAVGTGAAVLVPHGCYVLAVLFGVACLLAPYAAERPGGGKRGADDFDAGDIYAADFPFEASNGGDGDGDDDDCPPRFCF